MKTLYLTSYLALVLCHTTPNKKNSQTLIQLPNLLTLNVCSDLVSLAICQCHRVVTFAKGACSDALNYFQYDPL